eukprot:scaffold67914_cov32-Prasinocladus_malaysianus.AAC.2
MASFWPFVGVKRYEKKKPRTVSKFFIDAAGRTTDCHHSRKICGCRRIAVIIQCNVPIFTFRNGKPMVILLNLQLSKPDPKVDFTNTVQLALHLQEGHVCTEMLM